MKKHYDSPVVEKIILNTQDIMSLSDLLSIDDEEHRDTFQWNWN